MLLFLGCLYLTSIDSSKLRDTTMILLLTGNFILLLKQDKNLLEKEDELELQCKRHKRKHSGKQEWIEEQMSKKNLQVI
jgi:hypothetical protein